MRILACLVAAAVLALVPAGAAAAKRSKTRPVLTVANNWEGTADLVDPKRFKKLKRINIIPDIEQRMAEIRSDPNALFYFQGIRQLVGEGHDQWVDDAFTSPNGRVVYVSRPSLADVVAISLRDGRIVWRVKIEGYRADHMAISPDGSRLLVSASTARKVHVIDTQAGRIVGEFPSGDQPHENNYSRDGRQIYHASIGTVFTPLDDPVFDDTKGDRWFQIVDASTLQVLRRVDMGDKLAEHGYPNMSAAVRPMALTPDERYVYFQLSFLHGFVEYDLVEDRPLRIAQLPLSEEAQQLRREQYLLDSAHHGLAMNPAGTKLCAAGTMSDYAAIVRRDSFAHTVFQVGEKPYWSTNGLGGRHCWVSVSGDDKVVVLDYRRERQVAEVPVGDHPQRVRLGAVKHRRLAGLPIPPGSTDNLEPHIRVLRGRRCRHRLFRARIQVFDQSPLRSARAGAPGRSRKTRSKEFRIRVPVKELGPGRHKLRVRAVDTAGNAARRVIRFRRCR